MNISHKTELGSYWSALEKARADELKPLMKEIKGLLHDNCEEVYFALADNIFTAINCFQNGSEQLFSQQLKNCLEGRLNQYYTITPFEARAPFHPKKSVYAIRQSIIDAVIDAAKSQDIMLMSIEPASVSYVRAKQSWRQDYAVVELFKEQACIFTFSPFAGVFRQDVALSETELLKNLDTAEDIITTAYSTNTFNGGNFFSVITPDIKYTILTDSREIREIPVVKKNSEKTIPVFPGFVEGNFLPAEQSNWMIPVGALIQDYPDKEALYPKRATGTILLSSNLIPIEFQKENTVKKQKASVNKHLRLLAACLTVVLVAEAGGVFWFSQKKIDPSVQAAYNAAKRANVTVRKGLEAIKLAKKEDNHTYEYLIELLNNRPADCLFSQVTIGSSKTAKNDKRMFVKLKTHSRSQVSFNDFIGKLQRDKYFLNPVIDAVQQPNNSLYTVASIQIGKGESFKDGKP